MVVGGPKEEEARGVHRKAKIVSLKTAFALTYQKRMQAKISTRTRAEARNKKEKGKKGAHPKSGFSTSEAPNEENHNQPLESEDWYDDSSGSSVARGTTCMEGQKGILPGWHQSPLNLANHQKVPETCIVRWHYDSILLLK